MKKTLKSYLRLLQLFETELSCVKYYQGNKAWAYISLLPLFAALFQLGCFWTSRYVLLKSWGQFLDVLHCGQKDLASEIS